MYRFLYHKLFCGSVLYSVLGNSFESFLLEQLLSQANNKEERIIMLLEDDIRLAAGIHGWKVALRRLHPENPVYLVTIYQRRRRYCLGLLGELQRVTLENFIILILSYAE